MARGSRSHTGIVQSGLDVKSWLARVPSVDEARPGQCPDCGAPSRPAGERLALHGHGLRVRQLRGPLEAKRPSETVDVLVRRYRCQPCTAIITVVPRGVAARRHYSSAAIGLALALYGLVGQTARAVRERTSAWRTVGATAYGRWASLRRWIRAVLDGTLFARLGLVVRPGTLRAVAEQAGAALAAHAPPAFVREPIEAQAFAGGARMA